MRAGGSGQKIEFSEKSHRAESYRTVPKMSRSLFFFALGRTIAYAYTLPNAIAHLYTGITYLNTLTRLSALGFISYYMADSSRRPIRIEQPRTRGSRQPIRIGNYVTRVVSQSESSTEKTLQLHQPIRIEYYVTRIVSQSESSITSPESPLRHPRALGSSGLVIAYLNT